MSKLWRIARTALAASLAALLLSPPAQASIPRHAPDAAAVTLLTAPAHAERVEEWLIRDPLGEAGGLNLTAFCGNDPINKVDPLGLVYVPGRLYEVDIINGLPLVQNPEYGGFLGLKKTLAWEPPTNDELTRYFTRTDDGAWRVARDAEVIGRHNATARQFERDYYDLMAEAFNRETVDAIEKAGVVAVTAPFAVCGGAEVFPLAKSACDSACIYSFVRGGYCLGRAAAPVVAGWQWLKSRFVRGQAPFPSSPLPGYGPLAQPQIGFIDRVTGQMIKQGPLGLDPGQLSSHVEIVEAHAVNTATAQGFSLIPHVNGTYILKASGQFGGDVSAVLARIAEFYRISADKIIVR
jgi:hypothetical protein